ncbi:MAG: formate dehydrogenase subunit delta [Porticoccaceae bacterium]|nr:formate dehydrogenase subunit delta [Porticoccaceae bacterium]MDG1474503.1 formate dehydrogenase subunit delta [Porticoccaceae bacterium]
MNTEKLDRLVKMINQISLNMASNGSEGEVALLVASHLEKFWSPPMITTLCSEADEQMLAPISVKAVAYLRTPQTK